MVISVIVWLIFLAVIISAVIKNGKRNTKKRDTINQKHADTSYRVQARTVPQEKKEVNPPRQRQMNRKDVYDKNNIVAAAKANAREVELDNDFDASQAKLMESVYDVMVKGPNDTISFQRDFLAEGLDLLNSFQSGNEL